MVVFLISGAIPMPVRYQFIDSPFGKCLVARSARGICHLHFCDTGPDTALGELARRFPDAGPASGRIELAWGDGSPALDLRGTAFQKHVWAALRELRCGMTIAYRDLAAKVGRPRAVRAVAGAVAANQVAWFVPCHRVVRASGELGGFRWGTDRKAMMLRHEGDALPGPGRTAA